MALTANQEAALELLADKELAQMEQEVQGLIDAHATARGKMLHNRPYVSDEAKAKIDAELKTAVAVLPK